MISKNTIKELTSKYQTVELNVIREYCQHLFLSFFYKEKLSEYVLFKGGTALRLIYNSPRFSEDLDFSAFNINTKDLEDLFLDTIFHIEKIGIKIELEESKFTRGGYLGIVFFEIWDTKDMIRIEVSLRRKIKIKGELNLIYSDYIAPFNVIVLPKKLLVEEKIKALLEREKPRDFFDIYFLLRSDLSLDISKLDLFKVLKKLETTKIDFKKELKILLPKSYHMLLKNFVEILRKEINKYGY